MVKAPMSGISRWSRGWWRAFQTEWGAHGSLPEVQRFLAIQVLSPPGPEQRFKKLANTNP